MSQQGIIIGINLLLWGLLVQRFVRALSERKLTDGASLQAWGLFFCLYLVIVLTVDTVEQAIDARFGGLPVTTLTRTLFMLAAAHLFYLGMRRTYVYPPRVQRWFVPLNGLTALVCVAVFLLFAPNPTIASADVSLGIKGVRDIAIVAWTLVICWPVGWYLWRSETLRPMKLHRALNLLFFAVLLIVSVIGLTRTLTVFFLPDLEPTVAAVDEISKGMLLLSVLLLLFPFRWLLSLSYPQRLLLYWRLRRVERALSPAGARRTSRWLRADELELAIYQQVVALLDRLPVADDTPPKRAIERIVSQRLPFDPMTC